MYLPPIKEYFVDVLGYPEEDIRERFADELEAELTEDQYVDYMAWKSL